MTKDVLVRVKGTQDIDGEKDTIEVITNGSCYEKNGKWYILYEEVMDELNAVTKNTVKISADTVEVTKKGLINAQMIYETGKKNVCNYATPMGQILMGITTKDIQFRVEENKMYLDIQYALEMNGQHVSSSRLELTADSRK
ncbi:MAG: DUF1934 domain-containing protein [Lachnospiraceae bacterium]|nr:DUF1934 domain-containing protein [Lachnospiraceae bacterium]